MADRFRSEADRCREFRCIPDATRSGNQSQIVCRVMPMHSRSASAFNVSSTVPRTIRPRCSRTRFSPGLATMKRDIPVGRTDQGRAFGFF